MTTNQILTGVGLILALAVGSQVLASRLRIPAIIVLLPAGFVAGALRADGQLTALTQTSTPTPQPGDTLVSLGPVRAAQPADPVP